MQIDVKCDDETNPPEAIDLNELRAVVTIKAETMLDLLLLAAVRRKMNCPDPENPLHAASSSPSSTAS